LQGEHPSGVLKIPGDGISTLTNLALRLVQNSSGTPSETSLLGVGLVIWVTSRSDLIGATFTATEPGWTKLTGGLCGVGIRTWWGNGDRSEKSLSKSEWVGVGMQLLTPVASLHSRGCEPRRSSLNRPNRSWGRCLRCNVGKCLGKYTAPLVD
jgi:hypothetical protein